MHDQNRRGGKNMTLAAPVKWAVISILVLSLAGCSQPGGKANVPSPTLSDAEASSTVVAITSTPSPTPIPQGSDGNPIVMGIVWSDESSQSAAAGQFIQYLADTTGFVFALQPFGSKLDLLTAMDQGKVAFSWLLPEDYLYASENNIGIVAFQTSHYGVYSYGSYVFVRSDSGFQLDFDPDTGMSKFGASAALRQFSQKIPCLVNQRSISGYAYPLGLLAEEGVEVKDPVLLQTHEAVIRAINTGGICDFGFTYGITGDPRTSSAIQKDIPDVMQKVLIAWQTPADIPTLNLTYATLLAGDIRYVVSSALKKYASNPDGLQTLSMMNNYAIDGIRPASDDDYENLRAALRAAGIDTQSLLSR